MSPSRKPGGLGDVDPLAKRRQQREQAVSGLYGSTAPAATEEGKNTVSEAAVARETPAEVPDTVQASGTATASDAADQEPATVPARRSGRRTGRAGAPRGGRTPAAVPAGEPGLPMPVAKRSKAPRVQLNTRVRADVYEALQRFVEDLDATVQDVTDMALTEFLERRGYPAEQDRGR